MARTNKKKYNIIFTKVIGDSNRPYRPGNEYTKKTRQGTIFKKNYTTKRRKNIQGSDRMIPDYIKQRIQVHYHPA